MTTEINGSSWPGVSLSSLPKSNVFTSNLPPDEKFPTPQSSHKASRDQLGPRAVTKALYTFVRPENTEEPRVLGVSKRAMRDIGLAEGEEKSEEFRQLAGGNKLFWNEASGEGIYPWAQCYGGWQFGSWASQLGDGRAISLFESTNPSTKVRYEVQLKGAGRTPYSRFADGKAVLRSSVREFVVSEALNALNIPTTRALALTLTPHAKVRRETLEPGAIVTRFAQSWLRIGTFDIMRARGDRALIRKLATYLAEHVFGGWGALPAFPSSTPLSSPSAPKSNDGLESMGSIKATNGEGQAMDQAAETLAEDSETPNRFARLYHHIAILNARTVAAWQAYGFTNGVLNTDNTSLVGLSLDFGPFAFLDNFDPSYTPNHDDHALRYSYRNQPSIIWWNLVRLGESLGELIGAGDGVDEAVFIDEGVQEADTEALIQRAERLIGEVGEAYKAAFLEEYRRLMSARLGLKQCKDGDFETLFSEALDIMEAYELDFTHFFRRLSSLSLSAIDGEEARERSASVFFHSEGWRAPSGISVSAARKRIGTWLSRWETRVREDWSHSAEAERMEAMKKVNPKFIPRGWVLDEVIKSVTPKGFSAQGSQFVVGGKEQGADTKVLEDVMKMALDPFAEEWAGVDGERQERWCGDVPREGRGLMCSCSS